MFVHWNPDLCIDRNVGRVLKDVTVGEVDVQVVIGFAKKFSRQTVQCIAENGLVGLEFVGLDG